MAQLLFSMCRLDIVSEVRYNKVLKLRDRKGNRMDNIRIKRNNLIISVFCTVLSLWLLAVALFFGFRIGFSPLRDGFLKLLFSPSPLITDYFRLGGVGATFLNAGLCGLACSLIIWINRTPASSRSLCGYFLIVAHCFYGLNFLNMWPCFFGVVIYCIFYKKRLGENLHSAMFATALAPFVNEFLFRYTSHGSYHADEVKTSALGVILALFASLLFGFFVPSIVPGTSKMYRGFNLYKAGLAIGLFGFLIYSFFFTTLGIPAPSAGKFDTSPYGEDKYLLLYLSFFGSMFLLSLVVGLIFSKGRLTQFRNLLRSSGHEVDFAERFGADTCLINLGTFGLFMVAYFALTICFTGTGVFTGPTFGVLFAAIAHTAGGQHVRNVYPVLIGFLVLSAFVLAVTAIAGLPIPWTPATQGYINAVAFATGLCPFSGKYGRKVGVIAGVFCAVICTSTGMLHGGLMLYNGGFSAGFTAMLLLPILDFFKVKEIPCPENEGIRKTVIRMHHFSPREHEGAQK